MNVRGSNSFNEGWLAFLLAEAPTPPRSLTESHRAQWLDGYRMASETTTIVHASAVLQRMRVTGTIVVAPDGA